MEGSVAASVYRDVTETPTMECPDAEHLAAFIEGRLDKGSSASVLRHIVWCDGCLEVFAETVSYHLRTRSQHAGPTRDSWNSRPH